MVSVGLSLGESAGLCGLDELLSEGMGDVVVVSVGLIVCEDVGLGDLSTLLGRGVGDSVKVG